MTPAVSTLLATKYTAAETATASSVGTNAPGGTIPPRSWYVLDARYVESMNWPKLKITFRAGFGLGVYAFTATTTIVAQRATPVPNRTYAAIFTAKATEIALDRNSTTGFRWATPTSTRMNTNITGSIALVRALIELATRTIRPSAATIPM